MKPHCITRNRQTCIVKFQWSKSFYSKISNFTVKLGIVKFQSRTLWMAPFGWGRPGCLSAAPSCKEAFRGSQDPLRSFQCRQQSIVSARDDVSTPTEGHNGCGKRASRLFQPTCTSVQEHDHKQRGTQSCPSKYARSLPTEPPHLRERSKTLASSQNAPLRGHPSGCTP